MSRVAASSSAGIRAAARRSRRAWAYLRFAFSAALRAGSSSIRIRPPWKSSSSTRSARAGT